MSTTEKRQLTISGAAGRLVAIDFEFNPNTDNQRIVIFAHGFKGFKDWGHFAVLAQHFVPAGFALLRFNFSHNGTTPEQPIDFADLEAFGHNRVRYEQEDLAQVIHFALHSNELSDNILQESVDLIGHSRGGGNVILAASRHPRSVRKVVSWSGISTFMRWSDEKVAEWKESGVQIIPNGRTKQDMPMYYEAFAEYLSSPQQFDVVSALKELNPNNYLQIHGAADETVGKKEMDAIHKVLPDAEQLIIPDAGHTFGSKHPRPDDTLPDHLQQAVNKTIAFLK